MLIEITLVPVSTHRIVHEAITPFKKAIFGAKGILALSSSNILSSNKSHAALTALSVSEE